MNKEIIVLGNWEKAKLAIAECKSLDEVKKIRDKAEALRAYAKQARESLEVQNNVAEIKIRCERRIGEFSKELPKDNKWSTSHDGKLIILKEAGIEHYERYETIANLPEKEFEKHIEDVKESNEELTTIGIIKLARSLEKKEVKETPPLPEGKFKIIYADPPWQYAQEQHSHEQQETTLENHYPTMPTEDICKLPINELAADNSVLFLWTTSPKLFEAKQVVDAWGFEYKSSMIWDKVKHNVGYYVSVRHEILLICTKGSCLPDSHKLIDSVQTIERTKHSEKPERFYEIIEEMYQGKKIELFSRNKRKNWDGWGNEI